MMQVSSGYLEIWYHWPSLKQSVLVVVAQDMLLKGMVGANSLRLGL